MRVFTTAAVQVAPAPGPLTADSVTRNIDTCIDYTRRCVEATGAELVPPAPQPITRSAASETVAKRTGREPVIGASWKGGQNTTSSKYLSLRCRPPASCPHARSRRGP